GLDRVWCSGIQDECPRGAEILQNYADQLEQVGRQQSPAQEYSREVERHTCYRRKVPRAEIREAISSCVRLRSCRRKPLPTDLRPKRLAPGSSRTVPLERKSQVSRTR